MNIPTFSAFFNEAEDFTKQDLLDLIDEFDEDDFEELIEFLIDLLEGDTEDEEEEDEIELSKEDVKAIVNTLDDSQLQDTIEYAIVLANDLESDTEDEDEMDEGMSSGALNRARIKRKKPAHKKAMKKLRRCQKAHKNLNPMKACGTDGKVHTKRSKSKRKVTSRKRKKLKNRITVK